MFVIECGEVDERTIDQYDAAGIILIKDFYILPKDQRSLINFPFKFRVICCKICTFERVVFIKIFNTVFCRLTKLKTSKRHKEKKIPYMQNIVIVSCEPCGHENNDYEVLQ